jgi:hypothetical protein
MKQRSLFTLTALLTLAGCGDSCVTGPISNSGATATQQALAKALSPWTQHAKTCQIGGYVVMGPAEGTPTEIFVTRNGTTVNITERGAIHVRAKDGSLVSIQDFGGADHFDWISYDAIDPADGKRYSFTDANADGRLDTKIGEKAGFVNLDGKWSQLEKRGNELGALVDGEWRPLEKQGRMLFRPKSR